jgi:CheY-like chemotaxis protein
MEATMAKILVVDDDPDFVEIMRMILEAHGYEVASASNGDEALRKMMEDVPDLVVLDVMMSGILDGVNVSHEMSAAPALKQIPIVMVSSITSSAHAGMFPTDEYIPIDDWISKPVQPQALLQKVDRHLK